MSEGRVIICIVSRGIEYLNGHKHLKCVFLQNTHVTDEGLKTIGTWPQLSQLTLDGNDITSDGVRSLRGTTFYHLSLDHTRVGDDVFASMPPLAQRAHVSLHGTPVTKLVAVSKFQDVTEAAVYSDFYRQKKGEGQVLPPFCRESALTNTAAELPARATHPY